jgi:hypothetical protein
VGLSADPLAEKSVALKAIAITLPVAAKPKWKSQLQCFGAAIASKGRGPTNQVYGDMMTLLKEGRRLTRFLMIAVVAAQLGSLVARADITYAIDTTITSANPTGNPLQTDTVNGSITTDGTIGVLGASDILSWNLDLIDDLNAANDVDLTNTNSAIIVFSGNNLTATATGLFFNYSGTGQFGIQEDGFFYSGEYYFCFSTGSADCLAGETITPGDVYTDGVVATGSAEPVGTQPLGPPVSPVPEPTSVFLFSTLLLAVALVARKRIAQRPSPATSMTR